nr:caspase family protein [Clostridium sp. YIM B02555]
MSNVKALVVGVSNYYIPGAGNLPFCMNDVIVMEKSLHNGLKLRKSDIVSCGSSGDVKKDEFINALLQMTTLTNENDILIFYFSGHGTTIDKQHYLVFSDGLISTQEIIGYFEKVLAKSKIIFLDCCFSGNFFVDKTSIFNIEKTVTEFTGKGYAVFTSSNSAQVSYGHPDKPISVFTSFLCSAFQDKYIIRKGKITLYDIKKLVSLYLEVWSKRNPDKQQHPIFRANMGGTIFFQVQDYQPFYTTRIYAEYDKYIIYNVEPVHAGLAKRYSVKVILKEPLLLEEIGEISLEIKDKIKLVEVYNNEIAQKRLSGRLANIVWIYFGRDESDMINSNFICHTTWVDDEQDKKWWYRVNDKDMFMLNGVHYDVHSYYEQLKSFTKENTASKDELILKIKELLSNMLGLAEKVICKYNEYKNETLTEAKLFDEMEFLIPTIDNNYFASTNLGIAPDELHDWAQACALLFGTIHDFTLLYNRAYKSKRTSENRQACMEDVIKRYYFDLDKVCKLERQM